MEYERKGQRVKATFERYGYTFRGGGAPDWEGLPVYIVGPKDCRKVVWSQEAFEHEYGPPQSSSCDGWQRFWENALPGMREKLAEKIRFWLLILNGGKAWCLDPPCVTQSPWGCKSCLLHQAGIHDCAGYHRVYGLIQDAGKSEYDWRIESDREFFAAKEIVCRLTQFLPDDHPLRVKVNAAPKKWEAEK